VDLVQHAAAVGLERPVIDARRPAGVSRRLEWLAAITEDDYKVAFRNSAIKRAKWRGLVRNACIALGNARLAPDTPTGERVCALLNRLAESSDPTISESALWALSRIQ